MPDESLCCAICHEPVESVFDPLVFPCKCTSRCMHTRCLQQWNVKRPVSENMHRCEVCKAPYWGSRCVWYGMMTGVWLVQFVHELCLRKTWKTACEPR